MSFAMSSSQAYPSAFLDGSVKVNDVVIADIPPTFLLVPGPDVCSPEIFSGFRG